MLIYAIDDERNALSIMLRAVEEAEPSAEVRGFSRSAELLSAMEERPCDVVFLDVEMPGLSGVALAKRLKAIHPKVNVIFATGYDQYKGAAMDLRASGYLMKPVTAEDVRTELDNLRHPVPAGAGKRVRFRTFGNFEVFIDGHNVSFRYDKTLELLAYLVDARELCTNEQIINTLWGGELTDSYFRMLRKDLLDAFRAEDCEDVFLRQRRRIGVDAERVDCDFYDWLRGDPAAINAYWGEYMSRYAWAERTRARLNGKSEE